MILNRAVSRRIEDVLGHDECHISHDAQIGVESGKFRLHKRPPAMAIKACRPWLDAELQLLEPAVVVLMGATAAQAILGADFRVTRNRGKVIEHPPGKMIATLHPSAILRAPDSEAREEGFRMLVSDLKLAKRVGG